MTIASEIERLQCAKACLKASIEAKGVSVPSDLTLEGYYECVDGIESGGAHLLDITLVGGGGGGGGGYYCNYYGTKYIGGGGGGGGEVLKTCILDGCKEYSIIIGEGGTGGAGKYCMKGHPGAESDVKPGCSGGKTCFIWEKAITVNGGCGGGEGTVNCGKGGDSGNGCSGGLHYNCNYECRYNNAGGGGGGAGGNGCNGTRSGTNSLGGEGYLGYGYGGNGHHGGCGGSDCADRTPIVCGNGGTGGPLTYTADDECMKGKDGHSGVVEVCYLADGSFGITSATGGDCCYVCDGYCIHRFTSNGTFCITG